MALYPAEVPTFCKSHSPQATPQNLQEFAKLMVATQSVTNQSLHMQTRSGMDASSSEEILCYTAYLVSERYV